ncbi:hypothetical protein PGT21_007686 [Puccinia graminis f. sp. tritici]|uniref:BED-type domain-containing protein n=2 Tax=Puccinia graminis f. sp. tritici TaxID=56615 RepID=A0A5B0N829_PUCGR|nr:hypothetical protein PGT21_007686 [Puccinia graminis f. sp. tritici]
MRRPHHPPKRSRRESSPNTASTSVSDGAAAAATDPIDVDEEQLGESQVTPSASGGPAGANTDQEELSRAQRIARTAVSTSYASYNVPELSNQLDKNGRRMIAYPCKLCGKRINRPTSDSSCSNLLKHAASCVKKKHDQDHTRTLGSLGVTGTGDIDPREVTQKCAIWCAEAARPFSALEDNSLKSILHPTVLKNLPNRRMVSKAIHVFYTVVQEAFKLELKSHTGALYLGLDAWQSPNGFDILGIVVYWLNERAGLQSMPLDFIKLSRSHTGKYLAETVQLVVEKFGIASKITRPIMKLW